MNSKNFNTIRYNWTTLMEHPNRDTDATVILKEDVFTHGQLPKARLICLDKFLGEGLGNLEIPLVDEPQTLGRGRENTVYLNFKTLSREHARVLPERNHWVIEDCGSSNGVFVNDEKISRKALTPGDVVKLASLSFRFVYDPVSRAQPVDPASDVETIFAPTQTERTMYSGHPGVVGSLAADVGNDAVPEELPEPKVRRNVKNKAQGARRAAVSEPVPAEPSAKGNLRIFTRIILPLCLFLAAAGGTYFYFNSSRNHQITVKANKLKSEIQKFVEAYDSDASSSFAGETATRMSQDLQKLDRSLADALGTFPDSVELRELQATTKFLDFEHQLQTMTRKSTSRIDDAPELVRQTTEKIETTLGKDEFAKNRGGLRDLTGLADAIVKFKLFSKRFPLPASQGQSRPTVADLEEMRICKDLLVKAQRENHLVLLVTYPLFQRLVTEVEKNDVYLYQRWKELLH